MDPCAFGDLDGMIRSPRSAHPAEKTFSEYSWDTQPNGFVSFNKATDPFPPLFFDFLLDHPTSLSMSERTIVSIFASGYRLVFLDMREDAMDHMTVPHTFFFARLSGFLSRTTLSPGTYTFRGFSYVSLCLRLWSRRGRLCFLTMIGSVAETARVSF